MVGALIHRVIIVCNYWFRNINPKKAWSPKYLFLQLILVLEK